MQLLNLPTPETWVARNAVKLMVGVVLAAAVAFVVWWVFIHPGQLKDQLAQSRVDAKAAQGQVDTAAKAADQTATYVEKTKTIEKIVEKNHDYIMAAPGAQDEINPELAARGIAALCLYDDYAGKPPCA